MANQKTTYSSAGIDYNLIDPVKKNAQQKSIETSHYLEDKKYKEVSGSRGESAFVWEQDSLLMASVIEGLGTKNLIADAMRQITGKTYYDVMAHDTVATVINDLVSVGALPLIINAYWATGNTEFLKDTERMQDLIEGWKNGCDIAGVTWGGGETPTLKGIINDETIDLAGSAVGVIKDKTNYYNEGRLTNGDKIILVKSNGVNANGLTLARSIASQLSEGYATKLPSGIQYGEALLTKSNIYARLIQELQKAGVTLHYVSYISGHGMRKIMRARGNFTYVIEKLFDPQEVFTFIKDHAELDEREMYGTYNMGQDYALFLPAADTEKALGVIRDVGFEGLDAGYIESGERQVILKSKDITFSSSELNLR